MNGWFLAAGALLAAAFFVHLFSGNRLYSAARPDAATAPPRACEAWMMGRCGMQMISVDLLLAAGFLVLSGLGALPRSFWFELFLLLLFGAKRPLGIFFMEHFGVKLVMNWYSAIFASIVVAFPLMYRTARGAFESFDETLAWSAQTLGQSNAWIFWRVRMPCCRQGILAGTVLAFARALGEYGATSMIAGYTPGKTATIATTVYQLWRTNDEAGAMRWVLVDIVISAVVLLAVTLLEKKQKAGGRA